jgi:O-antigen/teichoic acid export membrane protein
MSAGTFLTLVFGVATNKILALVVGPEGFAVLGLYRSLTVTLTGIVSLGMTTVIVQRISTAKSDEAVRREIRSIFWFVAMQAIAIGLVAVFFGSVITHAIFGGEATVPVSHVRWVLVMAIGVQALAAVVGVLNGQVLTKESTRINVLTSAATAATTYPLLLLGNIGLAFVIGLTCFLGAGVGARYIWRHNGLTPSSLSPRDGLGTLARSFPISLSMTLQPMILSGGALLVQTMVARHYGLTSLGWFNAAHMLEGTSVLLLTSAMRAYVMPMLGKLDTTQEKSVLVNKTMTLLLAVLFPGVVTLIFAGPVAVRLLFDTAFEPAVQLIAIISVSIVAQAIGWCYVVLLSHFAAYRSVLAIDAGWVVARVMGVALCIQLGHSLVWVAATYTLAYYLYAIAYSAVAVKSYGRAFLSTANVARALATALALALGCGVAMRGTLLQRGLFLVGALALWAVAVLQVVREVRSLRRPSSTKTAETR